MKTIAIAVATAAAIFTATPLFVGAAPAKAQGVELQINGERGERGDRRDRDDRGRPNRRDKDVTVGVGPGGIVVGPRERRHCRTVTTTVERDNGRRVQRTERVCD